MCVYLYNLFCNPSLYGLINFTNKVPPSLLIKNEYEKTQKVNEYNSYNELKWSIRKY